MKFRLICFSINRLIRRLKNKITSRHKNKLSTLIELKRTADEIEDNPNETILNLTGHPLSPDQINALNLGLRYGLPTKPNHFEIMAVAEDVWDQISRQDILKEGRHTQDKIKNSLRSLTYSYIDLDIKQFSLDRKKIRILNSLTATYAILKPDKGNGIVLMKRSDYVSSVKSLFADPNKFKKIVSDPTPTRLSSLQKYLLTLHK